MLKVCFDASFTEVGKEPLRICAIAGYLGSLDAWAKVEDEWRSSISDWPIKQKFHFTSLPRYVGNEKLDICIKHFSNIISRSSLDAVGAALIVEDWERKDWGRTTTPRLNTPYEQCLDLALGVLGEYVAENFEEECVEILCDSDFSESKIENIFYKNKDRFGFMSNISIGNSSDNISLQCADLAVGKLRRSWLNFANYDSGELPWDEMPTGGKRVLAFWSLRQGAVVARTVENHWRKMQRASD